MADEDVFLDEKTYNEILVDVDDELVSELARVVNDRKVSNNAALATFAALLGYAMFNVSNDNEMDACTAMQFYLKFTHGYMHHAFCALGTNRQKVKKETLQ